MTEEERRLARQRDWLIDAMSKPVFWLVLAYFLLVIFGSVALVGFAREQADRSARRAQIASDATARRERADLAYQQCLKDIPFTAKLNGFIEGVRSVGGVLLGNSIRMHEITPPGSQLYMTQAHNIAKLKKALDQQKGVKLPPVTKDKCKTERVRVLRGDLPR